MRPFLLRHPVRPVALLRLFLGIVLPLLPIGWVTEDLLEGAPLAFEQLFLLALHRFATPQLDQLALLFSTGGGVSVIAPLRSAH